MFSNLQITSPIAFFDLETTGFSTREARIVEWAVLRIEPESEPVIVSRRCNPGVPIPEFVSSIHGIYDHHVSDLPRFADQSEDIVRLLYGATVAGFNILKYDIPLLNSELDRANYPLVRIPYNNYIDVMKMFHFYVPRVYGKRNLSLAYELYCGEVHRKAHGAESDVIASAKILDSMVGRHKLSREVEMLSKSFS
jgi:DNA polymerase-3 subunit epsilon